MKKLVFLLASAALLTLAGTEADARDRHDRGFSGHRHGGHHHDGRHWHRPHYWGGHHHWSRAYHWYPRWWYAAPLAPLYSYAYWDSPVYVERVVERPVYVERVQREPSYVRPRRDLRSDAERVERSHARIDPDPPRGSRIERMTLSATELFEFDKATLRLPQPKLDEIADVMQRNAQIERITVTGYTDRIGSDEYNLKLSMQRANAVKSYLVSKGVAAHRIAAVGKGEAEPVVNCDDKDRGALIRCLEPNRRVVVEQITVEKRVPLATRRQGG